jgi:hypothetical protein
MPEESPEKLRGMEPRLPWARRPYWLPGWEPNQSFHGANFLLLFGRISFAQGYRSDKQEGRSLVCRRTANDSQSRLLTYLVRSGFEQKSHPRSMFKHAGLSWPIFEGMVG